MIKNLSLFLFMSLFILLFYFNSTNEWFMFDESISILHFIALGIALSAMALVLVFRRSKLFLLLLTFLIFTFFAEWFDYLRHTENRESYKHVASYLDFYLLSVVSVLTIVISYFKDRGIVTFVGISRLLLVIMVSTVFIILVLSDSTMVSTLKEMTFFSLNMSAISEFELLVLILVSLLFFYRWYQYKDEFEWIFLCGFIFLVLAALIPKTLDHLIIMLVLFSLLSIIDIISRSYHMAYVDELTGLKGRRALNEALVRMGEKYTVVMGDIDFFKNFNDTYGHDVGDEVLKLVARELLLVKGGGQAFRWGGEEFVLLFSGKSTEESLEYVEMVRRGIEKQQFQIRDKSRPRKKPEPVKKRMVLPKAVTVTMSFGMASSSDTLKTATEMMKQADKKLYEAKESGRNCVRF